MSPAKRRLPIEQRKNSTQKAMMPKYRRKNSASEKRTRAICVLYFEVGSVRSSGTSIGLGGYREARDMTPISADRGGLRFSNLIAGQQRASRGSFEFLAISRPAALVRGKAENRQIIEAAPGGVVNFLVCSELPPER